MAIISVSLPQESIDALTKIQEVYRLKGRSEAMRTSINAALAEIKEITSLSGEIEGVLIIVRNNHADPWMIKLQAKYEEIIKTQMHAHLENHRCLEIMVLHANSDILKEMISDIQNEGKAEYVKFMKS